MVGFFLDSFCQEAGTPDKQRSSSINVSAVLNSGFAAGLWGRKRKSRMIPVQSYSPRREMESGGRPLGRVDADQPANVSAGRWWWRWGLLRGVDRTEKA